LSEDHRKETRLTAQTNNPAELLRLVRDLRRARKAFLEAAQALPPAALDAPSADSGWTFRRIIRLCGATERSQMTCLYSFFSAEIEPSDDQDALESADCPDPDRTLARECAQLWLAGRETEMWLDLIENESVDAIRHASRAWPEGGWTIREVFKRLTDLYVEKAAAIRNARR
jgi:hypothetical protein